MTERRGPSPRHHVRWLPLPAVLVQTYIAVVLPGPPNVVSGSGGVALVALFVLALFHLREGSRAATTALICLQLLLLLGVLAGMDLTAQMLTFAGAALVASAAAGVALVSRPSSKDRVTAAG